MSENLIIAIIGVISSISVFFMTLIANKISYIMNFRDIEKRKIYDEINNVVYLNIEKIHSYKFELFNFTNKYISLWDEGKADINNNIELIKAYIKLIESSKDFITEGKRILHFIDSHLVILYRYKEYYDKLDELYFNVC